MKCDFRLDTESVDGIPTCINCGSVDSGETKDCRMSASAPSLLQKTINLANAVVTHVSNGLPKVDDDTYYARLDICNTCPFKLPGWECGECGCKLLVKARWADMECGIKPENGEKKWLAVNEKAAPKGGCCN